MANKIAALYMNDNFIYKGNICLFLKYYPCMLHLNQNFFDYIENFAIALLPKSL